MLNNPKLAGFLRGLLYAIVGVGLTYISSNIGASGLVSTSVAGIIVGIIGIIEQIIQSNTGRALFGAVR